MFATIRFIWICYPISETYHTTFYFYNPRFSKSRNFKWRKWYL